MSLIFLPSLSLLLLSFFPYLLGRPRFLSGGDLDGEGELDLSVIVPARDEEGNVGGLLESLGSRVKEVIVVDDGSTDATAEVAREHGARVVAPDPLPEGWKGKPWACQEGAKAGQGEWLLFLDADVRLVPGGLEKLAGLLGERDKVFSFCPYHETREAWESFSAFFNVLMVAGANAFGNHRRAETNDAEQLFGQSLLIRRADYEKIGGHESVKGEVLENFHLAPKCREKGLHVQSYLGRGVMKMRMFDSGMRELGASWKKGFTQGAAQVDRSVLLASSLWLSGLMMAMISMVVLFFDRTGGALVFALTCLAYGSGAYQCWRALRVVGNYRWWASLYFPLPLMYYQGMFFTALIEKKLGRKSEWKGRHVD